MFAHPTLDRLWKRGQLLAAYDASRSDLPPTAPGHPFRDPGERCEAARRWHDHGVVCWHLAKLPEARDVLERARDERHTSLGEDHADTLDTVVRLAALAHHERAPDTGTRFTEAIARLVAVHGEDHVRVAIARRDHAAWLRDRGELAEARGLLDRAVDVIERDLPAEHPDVVAALVSDAYLHLLEGTNHAAIDLSMRAIRLGEKVWCEQHPHVAAAELTLAVAEARTNETKRALKRFPSILKRLALAGPEHPTIAIALSRQAEIEHAMGRNYGRAEALLRKAIAMYRITHAHTPERMAWLLYRILFDSGRVIDAGELALELGDDIPHDLRANMTARLANHLLGLGDYSTALTWIERTRDLSTDDETRAQWTAEHDRWTRYLRRRYQGEE